MAVQSLSISNGGCMIRKPRQRRVCAEHRLPAHLPRKHETSPDELVDAVVRAADLTPVRSSPKREEPAYLMYVARHRCCCPGCDEWSGPPHHYPPRRKGGVAGDDRLTVPLCGEHHQFWHDHYRLPAMNELQTSEYFLRVQLRLLLRYIDGGIVAGE